MTTDFNALGGISAAELAALLPETQAALRERSCQLRQFSEAQRLPRSPAFPYQNLPPSARLTYELVQWADLSTYLALFAADLSPFVDARFKQRAELEAYAVDLLTDLRYSRKYGACDWLLRRRFDAEPLGVLHLYDLSHEIIGGRIPHCVVGFAVAAPFRRQGYGLEALNHLLNQAADLFGRTEARALSAAENQASQALLQKSGFTLLEERPATPGRGAIRLWRRGLAASDNEVNS